MRKLLEPTALKSWALLGKLTCVCSSLQASKRVGCDFSFSPQIMFVVTLQSWQSVQQMNISFHLKYLLNMIRPWKPHLSMCVYMCAPVCDVCMCSYMWYTWVCLCGMCFNGVMSVAYEMCAGYLCVWICVNVCGVYRYSTHVFLYMQWVVCAYFICQVCVYTWWLCDVCVCRCVYDMVYVVYVCDIWTHVWYVHRYVICVIYVVCLYMPICGVYVCMHIVNHKTINSKKKNWLNNIKGGPWKFTKINNMHAPSPFSNTASHSIFLTLKNEDLKWVLGSHASTFPLKIWSLMHVQF